MRAEGRALAGIVLAACVLRALRGVARWDEIALAYAAYAEPVAGALSNDGLQAAMGRWIGLHPPLHGLILAGLEFVWPAPIAWIGFSALCSVGAVWLVGRAAGWVAALALATAPLQLLYAAEVNNYPLAVLGMAALLASSRSRWPWFAAGAVLAGWGHVLGLAAAGGVLLWRTMRPVERGEWPRIWAAVGLGVLPVVAGAARLSLGDGTFIQPEIDWLVWGRSVGRAIGPEGLALCLLLPFGIRREPGQAALAAAVPLIVALGVALATGAAAPHQQPYLILLGPSAAVLLGCAVGMKRGRGVWVAAVLALLMLRGVRGGVAEAGVAAAIWADQARVGAVDVAVSESIPGDVLWLVSPALQADDDKSATGAVLWRIRPWVPMPIARPVAFEYTDWRYGQPRLWRERIVHTSTELAEAPFDHVVAAALQNDSRVFVALYEHAPATELRQRVERALRPYRTTGRGFPGSAGLGDDRLYVIDALAETP